MRRNGDLVDISDFQSGEIQSRFAKFTQFIREQSVDNMVAAWFCNFEDPLGAVAASVGFGFGVPECYSTDDFGEALPVASR